MTSYFKKIIHCNTCLHATVICNLFIDNLHPNRSVFIHVHVRYRYVSWSLELLKDGGIANMYNGYPLHFCVVDISPPLWHLIAFFYSGPKKILEVSAIPGRPVVRAEQAPATSPNFKNQFNIVVTQWATYQYLWEQNTSFKLVIRQQYYTCMYLGNFFAVPSSWVRTNPLPSHDVIFQKNNPLQHLPPCHSDLQPFHR